MNKNHSVRGRAPAYETLLHHSAYKSVVHSTVTPTYRLHSLSILTQLLLLLITPAFFAFLGLVLGLLAFNANLPHSFTISLGVYCAIAALISFCIGNFVVEKIASELSTGGTHLRLRMLRIVAFALLVNFMGIGVATLLIITEGAAHTIDTITAALFCTLLSFAISLAAAMSGSLVAIRRFAGTSSTRTS